MKVRNWLYALLAVGGFTAVGQVPARADIFGRACNETEETVYVAVGFLADRDCPGKVYCHDWVSEGWWVLEPGSCSVIRTDADIANNNRGYVHAYSSRYTWSDPGASFCTGSSPFTIYQDGSSQSCSRDYPVNSFIQIDTRPDDRFAFNLEIGGWISWRTW
ncbi:MAG: DUF1036 domain-containing protein [Leptolyngbya sp. SIO1E4]|nr:DUF1036 domain-containing protein [Leptolyngbya sp. SIO1E4]